MLKGYMLRQKQNHKQQAYFTACIMNCLATQTINPEDIYYGMHPEDKPDPSQERNEFLKAVGLPPMKIERG